MEEGLAYGYHLNTNKGGYLIGKCDSIETAEAARVQLVNGSRINNDVIRIHPHNDPNNASTCGVKILGSFFGSNSKLEAKLVEFSADGDRVIKHEDNNERYIIWQRSFIQKVGYLLRTLNPRITSEFVEGFVKD